MGVQVSVTRPFVSVLKGTRSGLKGPLGEDVIGQDPHPHVDPRVGPHGTCPSAPPWGVHSDGYDLTRDPSPSHQSLVWNPP